MKTQMKILGLLAILSVGATLYAQSAVFSYQGQVTDNGTNFTGVGQFKFALVTSTNSNHQATATAVMGGVSPNEFLSSCAINSRGNGYTGRTAGVTLSGGGGSGATAQANIVGGVVNSITVLTPGSGYSNAPTVTVDPPPANISYATYWSNDGTSVAGSEPSAAVNVKVSNGLFNIALGDTMLPNMEEIGSSLFNQPALQLQIWFSDGVNGFAHMNPPQNLTTVPYASFANAAGNLNGSLPTAKLTGTFPANQLSGTVDNDQLANNSVTVNAGTGLSGGGPVALGGSTTLSNAGVTSLAGGGGVTVSVASGSVTLGSTATSANTPNAIVGRDGTGSFNAGNITLSDNLYLPATTDSAGIIYQGGGPFIHGYGTANFFGGAGAGNFTLSGSDNVGIGANVLYSLSSGAANVAIGYGGLAQNTGGSYNVAIGFTALNSLTGGQENIAIGHGAGQSISTGNNNIFIGNSGSPGDNGAIRIGSGNQTSAYMSGIYNTTVSGVPVQVNSFGQLGVLSSSQKFKENIKNMDDSSDVLLALKPVTFKYKPDIDPSGTRQFGLLAEQVEKVDEDLVVHDKQHGIYTVRYQAVDAMLLNEFLKEHKTVQQQGVEIRTLEQQNDSLVRRLGELEIAVKQIATQK